MIGGADWQISRISANARAGPDPWPARGRVFRKRGSRQMREMLRAATG